MRKCLKKLRGTIIVRFKKIIKTICLLLAAFCILNCSLLPSFAYQIKIDSNGNFIREGGINEFDGTKAESYEETVNLETVLRNSGYILVNTDSMDITDEEFEKFIQYNFWFSDYIRPNEIFYWTKYRVYVYEPSYNDYMRQLEETGGIEDYTRMEINTSTVLISYAYWYSKDKAGTVCYEFNDNIPEWFKTGYLEIRSPIDIAIKLRLPVEDTYYVFYVSANTPFLVKMKTGGYNIVDVNALEFKDRETAIVHNNMIHIEEENTLNKPYVVNLQKLVEKYNIPSADISGQPDYSIGQNQNIPEKKTVVEEPQEEKQPQQKKKISGIILAAVIIIVIILTVLVIRLYKRTRRIY